jgi:hypothetical protein
MYVMDVFISTYVCYVCNERILSLLVIPTTPVPVAIIHNRLQNIPETLGRTNRLFSLIRHRRHRKRRVQQFFIVACIFVAAVTSSSSHYLATYTYTQRLMGGFYEVCYGDGLRCHNTHTKFHKYWFMHSRVNMKHTDTDSMKIR